MEKRQKTDIEELLCQIFVVAFGKEMSVDKLQRLKKLDLAAKKNCR